MRCKQFKNNIPLFFASELNIDDTESFITHATICKECAEELEIMHLLQMGLLQLDGDAKEETYDFKKMLQEKIISESIRCKKFRRVELMRNVLVMLVNLTVVIGIIYQIIAAIGGEKWLTNYF